jgi:hypothetical protein
MKKLRTYAAEMGLRGALVVLLSGAALAVALLALYQVSGEPAGNAPLTDGDTKIIVPASPGLVTATAVCEFGDYSGRDDDHMAGTRHVSTFGLSVLQWVEPFDGDNMIGILDGEPITLSEEVKACFRGK